MAATLSGLQQERVPRTDSYDRIVDTRKRL
jgi:hypothetical protein